MMSAHSCAARVPRVPRCVVAGLLLALLPAAPAAAQQDEVVIGLRAVGVATRVDPVPGGGTLTEARLVHPVAILDATTLDGWLRLHVMINGEGAVLSDGELAPGAWGEGYVDRRHPHTWLHEAMLTATQPLASEGTAAASMSLGVGFAPFGTDDPMIRPIHRYPVNHHLAQILERAVGIAALRAGPVTVEAGLFNGDEPESATSLPLLRRFGDSWSTRVTLMPLPGVELQGSHAQVKSPEHREGAGPVARKWSASARLDRRHDGAGLVALAEWARTAEAGGAFTFTSVLAEAAWTAGRWTLAYRLERTERPEEFRLADPFRSARPHLDNSIIGRSRWTLHTIAVAGSLLDDAPLLGIEPFAEVTLGSVTSLTPASFDPTAWYGGTRVAALSAGVRLAWGARLHRMGRYGAAVTGPAVMGHTSSHPGH